MKMTSEVMGPPQSRVLKRRVSTTDQSMTSSTESIPSVCMSTASSTATLADTLEDVYLEKGAQLISEGSICTPLKILKDLAFEYGTPLEVTTYEVHFPEQFPGQSNVQNRIFLRVGEFTGHGETARHRLALQLAAGDLLEQIKMEKGADSVAEYGLLPGCRLSPQIYQDLRELCRMEKLANLPSFRQINPSKIGSTHLFAFKCFIGHAEAEGTSDSIFLAKRMAAKNMYEKLTGEVYPDDRIATGSGCLRLEDLQALGITPITSARARQRDGVAMGTGTGSGGEGESSAQRKRRYGEDSNDGLHTDDFAEEEDHVVILRKVGERLDLMKLTDTDMDKKTMP